MAPPGPHRIDTSLVVDYLIQFPEVTHSTNFRQIFFSFLLNSVSLQLYQISLIFLTHFFSHCLKIFLFFGLSFIRLRPDLKDLRRPDKLASLDKNLARILSKGKSVSLASPKFFQGTNDPSAPSPILRDQKNDRLTIVRGRITGTRMMSVVKPSDSGAR